MNALRNSMMGGCLVFLFTACGGSGGNPPSTAQGRFIDSVVAGLNYSSGGQSGVTDSAGGFTYEVGSNIVFSVGNVQLGSATGSEVLTPVDITGSDSSRAETQNIVRFLLMLDSDGDSSNGISISSAVQSVAANWLQVDFSAADLASELVQIISDVSTADNREPVLSNASTAQAHLEDTLSCLASGVFSGTFSGGDNGTFLLWVQHQRFDPVVFGNNVPVVGVTSALVFSTDENLVSGVAPQQGISFASDRQFISGVVSTGAVFTGVMGDYRTINGSWQNDLSSDSGTFSGSRAGGGSDTALHRLSGFINLQNSSVFSADGSGVIELDVFADNTVTGSMVILRGGVTALSGTLSENTISVSGGGSSFTLDFDADGTDSGNDALLGNLSGFTGIGTLSNADNSAVSVVGTSCQPNN
ncbi:hypothetical protein MNBD_GAMMA11-1688 [hydrothermal vent metagenome]|uniref:Uncharacterized protein n=1 Tax=hydrothermal vent metagenome TaxID=652676 RepID=A0A3B0Y3N0_9ZZZZ